jgi:MYXO-CTERM domain-containing protein
VVEILYDGPSESFSWLVPVPGVPEVGVSSGHVLDRLQQLTNPTYTLNTQVEGECDDDNGFLNNSAPSANNGGNNGTNNGANNGDGGVSVIASGAVGPYDYQVIQVDPDLPDPTGAAVMWLTENGYDVAGPEILGEYLALGMNLLGFKLNKTASTGSIRPVTMTYQTQRPMIPIKLTGVAANDDMGVLVWVFGEWRAVPTNYRHLVLNEAAIDWINPNNNYSAVINLAADESGGQGFVTEAALPSDITRDQLVFPWEADAWRRLFNDQLTDETEIFSLAQRNFGSWDGFVDVVSATYPLPEGVTAEEFAQCPSCYDNTPGKIDIEGFDPDEFLMMLRDLVVEPAVDTQSLTLERPFMTRFYTTMSAAEMSLDPEFDFNGSLPDLSNAHQATRYIMCGDREYGRFDAPWRAELPSGQIVYGTDQNAWPYAVEDLPANEVIQQLSVSGMGEVIVDNRDAINQRLGADGDAITSGGDGDGCACATPAAPARRAPAPLALSLLAGLALLLRRRA